MHARTCTCTYTFRLNTSVGSFSTTYQSPSCLLLGTMEWLQGYTTTDQWHPVEKVCSFDQYFFCNEAL